MARPLCRAIHVLCQESKAWMARLKPAMTKETPDRS